jgi:mono/diheme cytochrome c family protein
LAACQQKMADQPGPRPDDVSDFFPDGQADRQLVPGTVARGHLRTDLQLFEGQRSSQPVPQLAAVSVIGSAFAANPLTTAALGDMDKSEYFENLNYVDEFPFSITPDVLENGRNRYMIYCVVCHDALGTGHGKIVERGYTQPPSYHIDRLRKAPVGRFFAVITNGYGSMPDYKQQIPPRDRWAIAAYIRALQLSQHFSASDMTADMKRDFEKSTEADQEASP